MEVYDPRTNTWTFVAPMNTKKSNLAAAALTTGGHQMLYALGGDYTNYPVDWTITILNFVEVYDPLTNRWTFVAPMTSKRMALEAAVLTTGGQEKLYALGGYDGSNLLNSVDVYAGPTASPTTSPTASPTGARNTTATRPRPTCSWNDVDEMSARSELWV